MEKKFRKVTILRAERDGRSEDDGSDASSAGDVCVMKLHSDGRKVVARCAKASIASTYGQNIAIAMAARDCHGRQNRE